MEEIIYEGEHLIYKQLGHLTLVLGFVASLLAAVGYYFATQKRETEAQAGWLKIGRISYAVHGLSVFTVIATIFAAMLNRRFEYQYVWQHVSEDLPFQYIFSAFWEGQEGSFLLWMFWHVVLGAVLMWRAKKWEAPVLSTISLAQAIIFTMILGIHFTDTVKMGSNPLLLLRDTMDIPLFNNANYVSLIQGNGLNPLLQNYWMVIHPPTLFLGFASTIVPFAFAVAGLWTRQHTEWLKPALPWVLFSGAILGTGILMGGAWAYEALSFGGYWAWDPVENMSLVPWITLVAGLHTHLVARNTGFSIKTTYFMYLISFVLVLYSTYLTRSGILGESSVHSFTELGLETQLLLLIGTFLGIGMGLLIARLRQIPAPQQEESLKSREFWMFIGSLILLFSATIITASTSMPVYNKIIGLFNPDFEGFTITDPVEHHNKYQLLISIFIGLLTGVGQFLRYRGVNWEGSKKIFWRHMAIGAVLAAALTGATSAWIHLGHWQHWVLMFSGLFAVVANLDFIVSFLKGNLKLAGSAFSHIGFGTMIVGIIASGLNKQNISNNPQAQAGLLPEDMLEKNVLLFKNLPMTMSGYQVTYEKDTLVGNLRTFVVNYEKLDEQGNVTESFQVTPSAIYDNKVTEVKAYNPSTKRYLGKDIFTHFMLPPAETSHKELEEQEKKLAYQTYQVGSAPLMLLDTVESQSGKNAILETKVSLVGINYTATHPDYKPQKDDFAVGVKLAFQKVDTTIVAEPLVYLRGQMWGSLPVQVNELSMKVRLPEEALFKLLEADRQLDYKKHTFKVGDKININGMDITFAGVNKEPDYVKQEGDVAVAGVIQVGKAGTNKSWSAEPVFLIREGNIVSPKAEISELGLHFYLSKINPDTETFEVAVAYGDPAKFGVLPVEIAKKSFRTDYIVLEAIVFPGINLFWLGSSLMMVGLLVSMFRRYGQKAEAAA